MWIFRKGCAVFTIFLLLALGLASCGGGGDGAGNDGGGSPPTVSGPNPANGATVAPGSAGQLLKVYAPGATSGTFYYDDDSAISFSLSATVSGDYLQVTIPYVSGEMNNAGTNYWYVTVTNASGTTRYPSSGQLWFTVSSTPPTAFAPSTWLMNYDWDCNGSNGTTSWHFKSDNTWNSDTYSGTWSKSGTQLTVSYTSGTTYIGTVSGASMSGTMISYAGLTGCWTATWQSNSKPLLDKVDSDLGGISSDGTVLN